jgi:hydroxyacylglutathione hydrolase
VPMLLQILKTQGLHLVGIVHTHAHIDHIGGTTALAQQTGAPTYLHPDDTFLYEALPLQARWLGLPPPLPIAAISAPLCDAMSVPFGQYELGVMHTPGHTPGSSCFTVCGESLCLAGDTLFAGSVGRTDLPGGDAAVLRRSIQQRLYTLPEPTQVICSHGPPTTIAKERRTNPYVRP